MGAKASAPTVEGISRDFSPAFAAQCKRLLAGRPGDGPTRTDRDVVDPTMFGVGGDDCEFTFGIGRYDLAVITACDDARAIAGGRQDAAAVHRDATRLAFARSQQQSLLT